MTTFALVHGAGHGAWCWDRLIPLLSAAGHGAIAMDLPCEDNAASFSDYATTVERALGDADDVILVGHSLGGLTVPLVAARRPVRHLVYLCALLPLPGRVPFGHDPDAPPDTAPGLAIDDHGDGTFSFGAASAATHLYNRCSPADVAWATKRLRRQSSAPNDDECPLAAMPDIERTYILCTDDRIVMPDHARYLSRTRAGVTPVEVDGDHSPFLSNVRALADLLLRIAPG